MDLGDDANAPTPVNLRRYNIQAAVPEELTTTQQKQLKEALLNNKS